GYNDRHSKQTKYNGKLEEKKMKFPNHGRCATYLTTPRITSKDSTDSSAIKKPTKICNFMFVNYSVR
ncbi:hypothetical protein L9F63_008544, partial [Diploptera punctata]